MSRLGTTTILGDLTVTGRLNTSIAIGLEDAITIHGEKTILKDVNNRFNALSFRNSNSGATAFSIMSFFNDTSSSGGMFFNSSTRVDDGGPSSFNIYNDAGAINLRTPTEVYIKGGPLIIQGGDSGFREGLRLNENVNGWVTLTMGGTAITGSGETIWSLHKNLSGDFCICNNSSNITDGLGLYRNGSITWKNRHLAQMISANGYYGLIRPDNGDQNDWIRTTVNGFIPYQSGGASNLGTASWPFQNIFANDIYCRGTLIDSKFVHQLRRTSAENLNNPNYPNAYTASATDGVCATSLGLPQVWHHFQYFRHEDNNGFGVQIAYPLNNWNETIRFRSSSGTTWSYWKKILCTSADQNVNGLWYEGTVAPSGTMRLNYSGYLYATRTYNAVWNDYAENFEKLDTEEIIEPGDVVVLAKNNTYKKSTKAYDEKVVGVYSDSYGHLLGGTGDEDIDKEQCVPVGLAGRVSVKVVGKVKEGQLLTSSHIPGVAMYASEYKPGTIIGKAVEDKETEDVSKIKMFIMNI